MVAFSKPTKCFCAYTDMSVMISYRVASVGRILRLTKNANEIYLIG